MNDLAAGLHMDHKIEPMTPDDVDPVVTLWRRTEGVGLTESDTKANIALFFDRNPGLSFVASVGGEIIGAVLCGHDGRRDYLHHLAVASEHRRKGVGKSLVDRCLAELRRLGIIKCNIFIYANNAEGRKFCERRGWKAREDIRLMQTIIDVS